MSTVSGVCPKCSAPYERDGEAAYVCACGWREDGSPTPAAVPIVTTPATAAPTAGA